MNIYKVKIEKTLFIEAENREEAREIAFDDCEICCDEEIISISKSSRPKMREFMGY